MERLETLRWNDWQVSSEYARNNPVCITHFPAILSSSLEDAREHCEKRTNHLLHALALSRDAGGEIFEIVVYSRRTSQATMFSVTNSYVGNLLTGSLSGESHQSIETYMNGLLTSPFNMFLVGLYRQARREKGADFQYLRYWQILETLAESRNYDQGSPLVDFEGNVMMDDTQTRKTKGSLNIVFNLLRENGLGSTDGTWKNVNIWFAFRSAVVHYGTISSFSELSRNNVREWARIGFEEIQGTNGHDHFLWSLKEDTKMILMRQLVTSATDSG